MQNKWIQSTSMGIRFSCLVAMLMMGMLQLAWAAPRIQHWQSASGAPVFFLPTEGLPLVDIGLVFNAGSARDGQQAGLAALTSAMLDQGAAGLSADAIAQKLEGVGAQLSTDASRDSASVTLRSLTDPDVLPTALEMMTQIITQPDFPGEDLERLRQQTLQGIKSRAESPGTVAQLAWFKQIYGQHPYAQAVSGYQDTVSNLTRDDLQAFYRKYYVKQNAVVVIVGEVDIQQARQMAEQILSGLPTGQGAPDLPPVKAMQNPQMERLAFDSEQTHILSGVPGISMQDPDYFPLVVGNHVLGGSGFTSRIVQEIREKRGLSYSAYSYFSPMVQQGPFMMGLQTRNEKADEALQALHQTLQDFVNNGPTDEELEAAKKNITGGFALRLDSNKKLFGQITRIAFHQLPLDDLDHYIDQVNAVTRAQVQDAFQRRVPLDVLATVLVGRVPK